MYYELWDLRTRNLVDEFETEAEAFEYINAIFDAHGEEIASGYALGSQNLETGKGFAIADGEQLLSMARKVSPLSSHRG